ncbi:ABC transporter permease [Clostridium grantii]|uniref:Tungstate transport system permease protein n=1 Tax=Clostridium grantii DSM 8605 TaxID=1121316 RepID=A0A1M5W9N9_9CLOT|nr:ABC transporter permease [Clostridium grantii]SHH84216.1 tungstate transport system permease protein [Clostridium grantii DSM 8605]
MLNINMNELILVISMSLIVSLTATTIAAILGISLAIITAIEDFKLKKFILRITDILMSIPPVLMGLLVYILISRKGPLGGLHLLFTPIAMIIAQTLLVFPIIYGLSVSAITPKALEVKRTCITLGANNKQVIFNIINECKIQLLSVLTAGFGRAISEVGAVMMVGGNIKNHTRVMTTFIALETSKGNFEGAILIGFILLMISFIINYILNILKTRD